MAGRRAGILAVAAVALIVAGCAQTSRVGDDLSPASLSASNKAVAVIRLATESPACKRVSILLGTRDTNGGYTRGQIVDVLDVRSLAKLAVAEVELDPGEYHVIGYACGDGQDFKILSDKADANTFRTSYASFSVAPGEVVNVGYLSINASHVGRSAFGRPLRVDVKVSDWPLSELERYKAERPTLYQQMTTRLLTISPRGPLPAGPAECARFAALKAAGKVANLPPECSPRQAARKPS